ncbi:MAG: 2-dehydropantoate 2-reductase [Verrucomicrobiales bacterium]|nr:2-dehydropantoate 2-reductase [Verrucomicrobiales bacterium]
MKIAILGAGAMGSAIGALLHKAGNQISLIDVSRPTIQAVQKHGLIIQDKAGAQQTVKVQITDQPASIGVVDLLLVFVKCYHTEAAVKAALPIIGPNTTVLSLQNGWGNGPRIAAIVGKERVVLGVCYHSATVLSPGHVLHAGQGKTFMGELNGSGGARLEGIVKTFNTAGIAVEASGQVLKEIWSKLALNVATLPTSSTVRLTADHLLDTPEMQELMKDLLREVVAVANAQNIPLDFNERWDAITGLLRKLAPNSKGSMLQDVENRRQTEIDVMCGAIIEAGARLGIATPYNRAMIGLIKGLEATFAKMPSPQLEANERSAPRARRDRLPIQGAPQSSAP